MATPSCRGLRRMFVCLDGCFETCTATLIRKGRKEGEKESDHWQSTTIFVNLKTNKTRDPNPTHLGLRRLPFEISCRKNLRKAEAFLCFMTFLYQEIKGWTKMCGPSLTIMSIKSFI